MAEDIIDKNIYLEEEILAPYTHLTQIKGKQIRVKIPLAFNHWLRVPDDTLRYILTTVNLLHNGSLLADDIQDNSRVRRGIPAAHCMFGVPLTLNATLHASFLVLQRILKLGPAAVKIYSDEILEIVRGQGIDIYWRENLLCPAEEEYKNMLIQKTGHMFVLGVRLIQLFSKYDNDLSKLALLLGLYFQIRDDYCNLTQQEALEDWPEEDKQARKDVSFCEDITEGKFSLPIIHAMNSPYKAEVLNILRQRPEDVKMKKYCLSLLEKAGSLQYTRNVLDDMDRRARTQVARLGGNPDLEAVLDEMLSWKRD